MSAPLCHIEINILSLFFHSVRAILEYEDKFVFQTCPLFNPKINHNINHWLNAKVLMERAI